MYRSWCRRVGHSISKPTIAKIADFLLYLRRSKNLSAIPIAGYRSMLSSTFRFYLPEISDSSVLRDLIRSFKIERPISQNRVPPWDLSLVLNFLRSSKFEPLSQSSLRELTKKTVFLLALASAKRIGELQAISKEVSWQGQTIFLSYLPEFHAKTESESNALPRSFPITSLSDFVGNMEEELLLCPVRCLRRYIQVMSSLRPHPRTLLVSPRNPCRALSKKALSFFLREVITQASDSLGDPGPSIRPRAHSIRGMATSAAFLQNVSIKHILEAASWKSASLFSSLYLKDIQFSSPSGFVAANACV